MGKALTAGWYKFSVRTSRDFVEETYFYYSDVPATMVIRDDLERWARQSMSESLNSEMYTTDYEPTEVTAEWLMTRISDQDRIVSEARKSRAFYEREVTRLASSLAPEKVA